MTRPRRIDAPGEWHHVMNRAAGRRRLFHDDEERRWFLEDLGQLEARFGIEVHAFCLMGNHYHVLVRSRDGRLSDAMKWLAQRFTQRANSRRGVDGSIFRGRFKSIRVEREPHLDWLYRYIYANPRDLGWTGPLAAYPWSGFAEALGERAQWTWCRNDRVLERWGSVANFSSFVSDVDRPAFGTVEPLEGCSWFAVDDAAHVARFSGGLSASDSAVRSVALVVGARIGMPTLEAPSLVNLAPSRRNAEVRRAMQRVDQNRELQAHAARVMEVLVISGSLVGAPLRIGA